MNSANQARSSWGWAILSAFLGILQIVRAIRVLQLPDEISAVLTIPAYLDAALHGLWALLLLMLTLALVKGGGNTLGYLYGLLAGFAAFNLLRLAVFAQADYDRARFPVLFILFLVLLIVPGLAFFRQRRMK